MWSYATIGSIGTFLVGLSLGTLCFLDDRKAEFIPAICILFGLGLFLSCFLLGFLPTQ